MVLKILSIFLLLSLLVNGLQFYLRPKPVLLPSPIVQLQKSIAQDIQVTHSDQIHQQLTKTAVDALQSLPAVVSSVNLDPGVVEEISTKLLPTLESRDQVYIADIQSLEVVVKDQFKTITDQTLLLKDYEIVIAKDQRLIRIWKVVSGVLVVVIVIILV